MPTQLKLDSGLITTTFESGFILANRYQMARLVGKGDLGLVYQAIDTGEFPKIKVAIKILPSDVGTNSDLFSEVEKIVIDIEGLEHPGAVSITGIHLEDKVAFLVTEYVQGYTLGEWIAKKKPLTLENVIAIGVQTCAVLDYAHRIGILNRDLKPSNIFLAPQGKVKVGEFEFADKFRAVLVRVTGSLVPVPPQYLAPEQLMGWKYTNLSEIYALGMILYAALAGGHPWQNEPNITGFIRDKMLPPLSGIPKNLMSVVLKSLQKDPSKRFESAEAFGAALQEIRLPQKGIRVPIHEEEQARSILMTPVEDLIEKAVDEISGKLSDRATSSQPTTKVGIQQPPPDRTISEPQKAATQNEAKAAAMEIPDALPVSPELKKEPEISAPISREIEKALEPEYEPRVESDKFGMDEEFSTFWQGGLEESEFETVQTKRPTVSIVLSLIALAVLIGMGIYFYIANLQPTSTEQHDINIKHKAAPSPMPKPTPPPDPTVTMVLVKGGVFNMGCSPGDQLCAKDERPKHAVELKPYFIDINEVTIAEYKRCVAAGECGASELANRIKEDQGNRPVIGVSWFDAKKYCEWVGKRLPTEAEWENAAKAGKNSALYGKLDEIAWYESNSQGSSRLIGEKKPNAIGLYDILGNVWEWCADWYDENYYGASPKQNPTGPESGTHKVIRGGGWQNNPKQVRTTYRVGLSSMTKSNDIGFRCAKDGN